MRELTDGQELALERIANSPAAGNVTIVGWAAGGPVLRLRRGKLAVLLPSGVVAEVDRVKV